MPALRRATGLTRVDVQEDFARARRGETLRRLSRRLLRQPGDVDVLVPFDEAVAELGYLGEVSLGLQTVAIDSIVGSVAGGHAFDRAFRPTNARVRARWERIAAALRRGEPLPPISLYRLGEAHFVRDGHHRVSVARALGYDRIEAYVTEVRTRVGAGETLTLAELPRKGHERLFRERVPLAADQAARVVLSDPWRYGELAEGVEGWGFRVSQDRGRLLDRTEVARAWFEDEFEPVLNALHDAGLVHDDETDADAYVRLGGERYRLMRTLEWSDEVVAALRRGAVGRADQG